MKKFVQVAALGAAVVGLAGVANATTVYQIDVTTSYSGGPPAGNFLGGGTANPDTGFASFTNNGPTAFTGTIGYSSTNACCNASFASLTLAPGQTDVVAIGNESSNQGGLGVNGVALYLNGNFGATGVNLSVNDSDIHSGVARTNPFGVTLDNFVLEGGDTLGRDTGDGYEETQAPGHFRFVLTSGVPEPATWAMMLVGFGGLGAAIRARRKQDAALFTA